MSEIRVQAWREFVDVADHLDVGSLGQQPYAFRGHADAAWELQPSLLRRLQSATITGHQALHIEKLALAEFRSQAHHHISPNAFVTITDSVSWLTLMQHHGAPTRLLDWSASIYVAAYFAVIEQPTIDGAIWIVHTPSVHERMAEKYNHRDLPKTDDAISAYFLQPDAPPVVMFAGRLNKSDRMIAQQGFFSICRNVLGDHGQVFSETFKEPSEKMLFCKLVIPAQLKILFARKLRSMNITANALFPGLDGLARSVGELILLGARDYVI